MHCIQDDSATDIVEDLELHYTDSDEEKQVTKT